jgi:predicted Zn-dependent peptidase
MWQVWAETKLPSTRDVLGQLVSNIERMSTELVSETELAQAKDTYVNASIFDWSSATKIVSRQMKLEYDRLPQDFFQQLRQNVLKVSKEDVLAVARKHLRLDRLKIIAVGSGGTLSQMLPTVGYVKDVRVNSSIHAVLTGPLQR